MGITRENVGTVVDGLGRHVDRGIREVVGRFNEQGFGTTASCEGHVGRALPYPWLDFPCPGRYLREMLGRFYDGRPPRLVFETLPTRDRLRAADGLSAEEGRQEMTLFLDWYDAWRAGPVHLVVGVGPKCGTPDPWPLGTQELAEVTCPQCR